MLPAALAGHPALDFCNTLAGWNSAEPREYLVSYAHLAVWAREEGLVARSTATRLCQDAELDPSGANSEIERARALRGALYAVCTDPGADAAWGLVGGEAHAAAAAALLVRYAPAGRRWLIPDESGLAKPVLELARAAGDLLASENLDHVGRCPGAGCGWLFLDPRGRRRWCTMAVCGNRAKAQRHAERARQAGGRGEEGG